MIRLALPRDSNPCFRRERACSLKALVRIRPTAAARERGRKMVADDVGRAPQRVGVKVRVARRRRRLRVAEKLADDRKAKARAHADRREGVTEIMDARTLEARVQLNRSPRLLEVRARPIRVQSGDDEGATSLAVPQEVDGGPAHHNRLSTGFAVGQVDESSLQIDMAPLKGQNLPQPRAGGT